MQTEKIQEILNEIDRLRQEVNKLQAEQIAEEMNISWLKPNIYVSFEVYTGITKYMKVTKVERTPDDCIKAYGKCISIRHRELSTKVSFSDYDDIHLDSYVDVTKIKEITEDKWNEIYNKCKEFVINFE